MNQLPAITSARGATVSRLAVLAAFGAAALSLFATNASAQMPVPQQQVDFDDLDLSKSSDTRRLYSRLRFASLEVCKDFASYRSVRMRDRHRECIDRALSGAIETIGNPSLAALHASKKPMLAQRRTEAQPQS